ncbi:osmotically inducible protein OsmC [Flavobacterium arsenatis]|uniref:Osmotically inducible protein OsmC n=1 Tax=Flavobacterium arsenatis TaxID=1484332 RepID=A0ABU1TQ65_9FLAO|nr:OsmC family protein [Flavobacterium arsenatis]MDR6968116.1 osmotically inducible protein OsmC [Flavobacterium arsenatis]
MNRSAKAVWNGTIKEGKGNLTTQSATLHQTPYSFVSRFDEGKGTNPEELMAAAHAGCFTMKLSLDLTTAGFNPEALETTAVVTLDNGVITKSALTLNAKIDGISEEQFLEIAQKSKETCPVSKAYNLEITLEAHLN